MFFKTHQKISSKVVSLVFGVLILCFALGFWALAWEEPSQDPPGDNVDTPLNVGTSSQTKIGGLMLNTGYNDFGLIIDGALGNGSGKVGIGVLNPDSKLEVAGDIKLGGSADFRIINVANPTVNSDVATKGYVDAANGGCGVELVGLTPHYTGNLLGLAGANSKCETAFPEEGSHWCSMDEIARVGAQFNWNDRVWVRDAVVGAVGSETIYGGAGAKSVARTPQAATCQQWRSADGANYGPRTTMEGTVSAVTCDQSWPLPCCR